MIELLSFNKFTPVLKHYRIKHAGYVDSEMVPLSEEAKRISDVNGGNIVLHL